MSQWKRLENPGYICERLIGFSVPKDGLLLIVSSDGTHLLELNDEIIVGAETTGHENYDTESGIARSGDNVFNIIGLYGGTPLLSTPFGEQLVLNEKKLTLSVVQNGLTLFSTPYQNFSGDWAAATFCPDGKFIVLGSPYDFDLRIFKRTT